MKSLFPLVFLLLAILSCKGQSEEIYVDRSDVERVVRILAADEMRGRSALFPEDIDRAAMFIAKEFEEIGLKQLNKQNSFFQEFNKEHNGRQYKLKNVIGVLPGKKEPKEIVVISAHYDHIGVVPSINGDSIANGADDNASGVAAMIQLAKLYTEKNNNERTLVFVAFTGEELGLWGSKYFADCIDPLNIVAMLNLEMIGKQSKFGQNTAYLTGFKYTNLGRIMQRKLKSTRFFIHPDPYPSEQLFFRSDNKPLAEKGVPAHTLSTVQINADRTYHTVADEVKFLDVDHIASIIKLTMIGISGIVSGEDTPARIKTNNK